MFLNLKHTFLYNQSQLVLDNYFHPFFLMHASPNNPFLPNCCQTDCKRAKNLKGCSIVQIELILADLAVGEQGHLHVAHVVFHLLVIHWRLDQLKVTGWGLVDTSIEVQGVAASCLVVSRLQIFEFMCDCFGVVAHEIVEADPETSWLLSKEIWIVLDRGHFLTDRQKLFRQLFCNDFFKPMIEKFEASTQEVWLQKTHKVLTIHSKVSSFAWYDEFSIFGHSLRK